MAPMPNFHACRLVSPDDVKPDSYQTAKTKFGAKPVQIRYAEKKSDGKRVRQSVLFPTSSWSETEAKRVCSGTFEPASNE